MLAAADDEVDPVDTTLPFCNLGSELPSCGFALTAAPSAALLAAAIANMSDIDISVSWTAGRIKKNC